MTAPGPDATAVWWARLRSRGPVPVAQGTGLPAGFTRSAGWVLPSVPEGAGAHVLGELGVDTPAVDQPNETARVLGAAVRCCWHDPDGPVWPGRTVPFAAVRAVFGGLAERDAAFVHRACLAAVRRLHAAGWLLWHERARTVAPGPRTATWTPADLTVLREMYRRVPPPPHDLIDPQGAVADPVHDEDDDL